MSKENQLLANDYRENEVRNHKEKIRSGQAFLYREGGEQSTVIDVHMKDDICGDSLNKALNKALIRYPYFTNKLLEENGDFYLVENPLPFVVKETEELHPLGRYETNYHLIDVTYNGKVISVAFHHSICDGCGIKPFVETLIYYYCTYRYDNIFNAPGVRLVGEPLLPGETKEPFEDGEFEVNNTANSEICKDGYALPEVTKAADEQEYYRYEVNINYENFMKFAKENNATPSIAIALLISKGIKNMHPEAEKPIVCHLASDMRKELNLDNTFKNCVSSLFLPYSADLEELTFKQQATMYRELLKEQKSADSVKSFANRLVYVSDKLDELNSYEAKKQLMAFFNNISLNTFILSYMGQIKLGEHEKYVDSLHMYSSGTTGLVVNMMSAGEYITVDFLQSFETDKYIRAFAQAIEEIGLEYSVSDKIEFTTPRGV